MVDTNVSVQLCLDAELVFVYMALGSKPEGHRRDALHKYPPQARMQLKEDYARYGFLLQLVVGLSPLLLFELS